MSSKEKFIVQLLECKSLMFDGCVCTHYGSKLFAKLSDIFLTTTQLGGSCIIITIVHIGKQRLKVIDWASI